MSITIQTLLASHKFPIDSFDRELIVAHVIQKPREFVLVHPEHAITAEHAAIIESLLKRRANHEPLAYLLGHREFFGLDFKVTKDTLIPRPETELMVEEILKHEQTSNSKKEQRCIIDVGTGSGCIIITLAKELLKNTPSTTQHTFLGVDISPQALKITKENARSYELENTITFAQSDLLENISSEILDQSIDSLIIAANLPYLSYDIYEASMPDVQNFEPRSALISDEDGLMHYRKLLEQIQKIHTEKKSTRIQLFFEISPEQKNAIEKLIQNYFPNAFIKTHKDLAGKYRLTITDLHTA